MKLHFLTNIVAKTHFWEWHHYRINVKQFPFVEFPGNHHIPSIAVTWCYSSICMSACGISGLWGLCDRCLWNTICMVWPWSFCWFWKAPRLQVLCKYIKFRDKIISAYNWVMHNMVARDLTVPSSVKKFMFFAISCGFFSYHL